MGLFDIILGDIGTELYSIYSMKKAIREAIPQAHGISAGQPAQAKGGSLFFSRVTLDDTKAYAEVIARLEAHPEGKKYVDNVSQWMKAHLSDWQKENFRIVVGHLMTKEYLIETRKKTIEIPGTPPSKKETVQEIKGNRGVDFFVSFAKCTDDQKMDICETTGLLSSPIETLKKAWGKIKPHEEEIIREIQNLKKRIGGEDYTKKIKKEKTEETEEEEEIVIKGRPYKGPLEVLEPWKKLFKAVFVNPFKKIKK